MTAAQAAPEHLIALNKTCDCMPIDRSKIDQKIINLSQESAMPELLAARENYFASTAVFVSSDDYQSMISQIAAIETVADMPGFREIALAKDPNETYTIQKDTRGAFMGYDFHITEQGPRLIEVNSNAGGAFIVSAIEGAIDRSSLKSENQIKQMFEREWSLADRQHPLKTIAIIDENPTEQYHYPDMLLAAQLLRRQGFTVVVTNPSELHIRGKNVFVGELPIDLVYNRLTDFALSEESNTVLRQAFLTDKVVVTPSPRHHALYADKRNLTLLSDQRQLVELGVSASTQAVLSQIPQTVEVTEEYAVWLWAQRRQYFFKPKAGFGSRAAYRGAKLTKKVWAHILKGGYVAQKFVVPPLRLVSREDGLAELKFDVRVYTYDGRPLLLAARIYQGQTTNLRTAGGGLAPVIVSDGNDYPCLPP